MSLQEQFRKLAIKDKSYLVSIVYSHLFKDNNYLMSPFYYNTLLTLLRNGAEGQSAEELRQILPDPDEKIEKMLEVLTKNSSYILKVANVIYLKQNLEINSNFKTKADIFNVKLENINFGESTEAAKNINDWVEDQTGSKIHKIVSHEDLNEKTNAMCVTGLYFEADWVKPFLKFLTFENGFSKSKSEVVRMDTMLGYIDCRYCENSELCAKLIELPLKGEASVIFVLPYKPHGLNKVEEKVELIFEIEKKDFTYELVQILLPKFKIATKVYLKECLEQASVSKIFKEGEADLSGIAGQKGDIHINEVIQKVYIEIGEEGIKAGAASPVETTPHCFMPPNNYKDFTVDHPFIFLIKVHNAVVFVGRVVDPSLGDIDNP